VNAPQLSLFSLAEAHRRSPLIGRVVGERQEALLGQVQGVVEAGGAARDQRCNTLSPCGSSGTGTRENARVIGESLAARILLVVFIERDLEIVRLISARRATRHERRRYEEG
jgi:hypothetical protein